MSKTALQLLAWAGFLVSSLVAQATESYSFGFTIQPKKLDGEIKNSGDETVSNEHWAYNVTLENRCFRDVQNLEIKYIIFMKQDIPGEKTVIGHITLKRKEGSTRIAAFKNNDKFSFTTESMEIRGTQLSGGYFWASGASPYSKDALKGLWLRVYAEGKQVAEYVNPPTLTSKEHWETPNPKKRN